MPPIQLFDFWCEYKRRGFDREVDLRPWVLFFGVLLLKRCLETYGVL